MSRVLPILFNTDMVRAILDDRKMVTRRCVKYKYSNTEMKMRTDKYGTRLIEIQKNVEGETFGKNPDGSTWQKLLGYIEPKSPYKPGDILYVRETWSEHYTAESDGKLVYCYKADGINLKSECLSGENNRWYPSIHMPKEAARIWLKVKDVRVERLQEITEEQLRKEGFIPEVQGHFKFKWTWDDTIKKSDLDRYGWDASPWVWVIEFERCEKPEGV